MSTIARALLAPVFALAVLGLVPADACGPRPPEADGHHPSGLAIAPLPDLCHRMPIDSTLGLAFDRAYHFAEAHPDDVGYPWDERAEGTLIVSAVTPRGQALLEEWSARPMGVAVRIRRVTRRRLTPPTERGPEGIPPLRQDRSFGELERIKDELIDIARSGVPGAEYVGMTAGDWQRNRVLIGVARLTDALAAAIVARYGTEVVAVLIGPRYGPFGSPSARLGT
jgi:hypothetical protein